MEKINFENYPSTNSPINGTNLNLLQDNIEDEFDIKDSEIGNLNSLNTTDKSNLVNAINEANNKTISTILYENENGATGNITLTRNVSNYNSLEIIYGCDGYYFYTKIYLPTNKNIGLLACYCADNTPERVYMYTSNYTINNSSVKFNFASNKYLTESNTVSSFGTNSYVRIYKVIGYI